MYVRCAVRNRRAGTLVGHITIERTRRIGHTPTGTGPLANACKLPGWANSRPKPNVVQGRDGSTIFPAAENGLHCGRPLDLDRRAIETLSGLLFGHVRILIVQSVLIR